MSTAEQRSSESGRSTQGVARALEVLSLFATTDAPTLGMTEVATELGLSKAVVHRILTALRMARYIELDESSHRYMLGPQTAALGLRYLDRLDVRGVIHEAMATLSEETNETVTFSVRSEFERLNVDQVTPDRDVKMVVQLGKPCPLHTGAASKMLLALLPLAEQEQYLETHDLAPLTKASITDPVALRRELALAKERGYAASFGERYDSAGSVAAPVLDYKGHVVGVISVSGPIERFRANAERAAAALVRVSAEVSHRFGFAALDHTTAE